MNTQKTGDSDHLHEEGSVDPHEVDPNKRPKSTYKVRLELVVLLVNFATSFSSTVFQDQVLYQSCTAVFGYNRTVCDDLDKGNNDSQSKQIEDTIQQFASQIFMTGSLVQAIVPAFIALFLGGWSDKFGRKPVMLLVCTGHLIFDLIKIIIAAISLVKDINPWYYIIGSIPVSLSGGMCMFTSAVYCYIADLTHFYERPFRMCLMGGVGAVGEVLGKLISGYFYEATNACAVFAISAAAQLCAILFIIFVIDESVKQEQLENSSKLQGLFDWRLPRDMMRTVLAKREHFDRGIILCLILSLTAIEFDQDAVSNLFFLFVRSKLNWTVENYSTFTAIRIVMDFVGATAGIIILQMLLGFKLTTMALIAFASAIASSAVYAGTAAAWYLYVGASLSVMLGINEPMCQAMIANVVSLSDIGKVFSLTTALQTIAPFASSPLYTYVYNSTLATYPGAFNLISVGIYSICFIAMGFVHIAEYYYPNVNKAKLTRR